MLLPNPRVSRTSGDIRRHSNVSSFRAPLTHSQTKLSGRLDIGTGPALQTRHVQPITSSSDERTDVYGVCVIGNGMMGSAAARHLSLAGCKVASVGPAEIPRTSWDRTDIFAAHYDEGRITRKTDPNPVWAYLSQRSIDRYPSIEEDSGIRFYYETGHLAVGDFTSPTVQSRISNAEASGIDYDSLNQEQLEQRFPYLNFPGENAGIHELSGAGWVSARRQVDAQLAVARKHGCTVVHEEVVSVEKLPNGTSGNDAAFAVHTASRSLFAQKAQDPDPKAFEPSYLSRGLNSTATEGNAQAQCTTSNVLIVEAKEVLVASGAFTNFRSLLPRGESGTPLQLDLQLLTAQTVKVELNDQDKSRLANMPSVIFKGPEYWCYILPPIKYPDGNVYLKLGGGCTKTPPMERNGKTAALPGLPGKQILLSHDEVTEWYRSGGDPQAGNDLMEIVHEIIPGLNPISWHSDSCVTCHTPTAQAYIGEMTPSTPGLFVLTGGNGLAAKSADELGHIAAMCTLSEDGWGEQPLDRQIFSPRLVEAPGKCSSTGNQEV